jgi:nucleoside-diphosphate-sugar epimerase
VHCLVTGASGYLGKALVPALARRGHRLSLQLHRGPLPQLEPHHQDPQAPEVRAATLLRCDFASDAGRLPLDGVDVLFHLAGIAHQRADPASYEQINVEASLILARRALAAGVKRFVFVSSVKAAGAEPSSGSNNPAPGVSDYARSKASAESGLRSICRGTGMELVILRPALIYSPDALGHLQWLRRWALLRLPAPPAGAGRSMVARDDVVRLLLELTDPARNVPPLITLTDGELYSTRRIYEAFCRALGRRRILPSPPLVVWRTAAAAFDRLRGDPPGALWERLQGEERYTATGLEDLGFHPVLRLEDCLGVAD